MRISDWSSDVCSSDLIAVARDLHRAEDRKIDMTAADHRETVSRREEARRRKCGDRLLAGVDEIGIDLIILRKGAEAEHAAFRLKDELADRRNEFSMEM